MRAIHAEGKRLQGEQVKHRKYLAQLYNDRADVQDFLSHQDELSAKSQKAWPETAARLKRLRETPAAATPGLSSELAAAQTQLAEGVPEYNVRARKQYLAQQPEHGASLGKGYKPAKPALSQTLEKTPIDRLSSVAQNKPVKVDTNG
jgi:hypothetical protein